MTVIDDWARDFGINADAVRILKLRMGIEGSHVVHELTEHVRRHINDPDVPGSEARQQALVRIEAADLRIRLFRNNSGAYTDESGRLVRYGLANESKQANEVLKSPDLIGWRPRMITSSMVGTVIAQCTMREMKYLGWTFNPRDKHECAQFNFLKLALADGCDAAFATGPGTL